jgi:hypothetical protein
VSLGRQLSLETSLPKLQKYREHDPGLERAIAALVDAEVRLDHPLKGDENS